MNWSYNGSSSESYLKELRDYHSVKKAKEKEFLLKGIDFAKHSKRYLSKAMPAFHYSASFLRLALKKGLGASAALLLKLEDSLEPRSKFESIEALSVLDIESFTEREIDRFLAKLNSIRWPKSPDDPDFLRWVCLGSRLNLKQLDVFVEKLNKNDHFDDFWAKTTDLISLRVRSLGKVLAFSSTEEKFRLVLENFFKSIERQYQSDLGKARCIAYFFGLCMSQEQHDLARGLYDRELMTTVDTIIRDWKYGKFDLFSNKAMEAKSFRWEEEGEYFDDEEEDLFSEENDDEMPDWMNN